MLINIHKLDHPAEILKELPCTKVVSDTVNLTIQMLKNIICFRDDRLIVVIGPCSINDFHSALEYADRLRIIRNILIDDIEIVMRVYFEKPRTTIGWKGLINDPWFNNSFDMNSGIRMARKLLLEINSLGVPTSCEFLDMITPYYISDLISWGAVGARTSESQIHRELASSLSCPVGFKNGTSGNIQIAIDAVKSSSYPHHFLYLDKNVNYSICSTLGNKYCHLIIRGGNLPNYSSTNVEETSKMITQSGMEPKLMIDCSHSNSKKKPENQLFVLENISEQISNGEKRIIGMMIESNLVFGRQNKGRIYGKSITDGCIDWKSSLYALEMLSNSVKLKRKRI